jgi:hypothetical protein
VTAVTEELRRATYLDRQRKIKMEPLLVREWDNEQFHRRVLDLESSGYAARRETYSVNAEQDPETGYVVHLYCIEMYRRSDNNAEKGAV